ncbi:MAG: hypothetical protein WBB19_19965 [Desulforhopalus sp.]
MQILLAYLEVAPITASYCIELLGIDDPDSLVPVLNVLGKKQGFEIVCTSEGFRFIDHKKNTMSQPDPPEIKILKITSGSGDE